MSTLGRVLEVRRHCEPSQLAIAQVEIDALHTINDREIAALKGAVMEQEGIIQQLMEVPQGDVASGLARFRPWTGPGPLRSTHVFLRGSLGLLEKGLGK